MSDDSIMVALDFSVGTKAILAATREMAISCRAKLVVLHVAAPDPSFVSFRAGPQHERDWKAQEISEERSRLDELARELTKEKLEVRTVIVEGPTAETILAEATRHNANLIVLGSHGRGALYQLVVGSVTSAVLRDAKIPVLVVPVANRLATSSSE